MKFINKNSQEIGIMPFFSPYAFVYVDKTNSPQEFSKTSGHELGHGAFGLEHPFTHHQGLDEFGMENLMSWNPTATKLCKYQWDLIQHPAYWLIGKYGSGESEAMVAEDKANQWGIIIIGADYFKEKVNNALLRIYASNLGHIVLDEIKYQIKLYKSTTPLKIEQSLFNESFDYNINTINFAGVVFYAGIEAQNYYETNLGHELWHVYQYYVLGNKYINYAQNNEKKLILEKGAIAFENYLASVLYNADYIRRKYSGIRVWSASYDKSYFNKYNERVFLKVIKDDKGKIITSLGYESKLILTENFKRYYNTIANYWICPEN
jgi:hypothetical protein